MMDKKLKPWIWNAENIREATGDHPRVFFENPDPSWTFDQLCTLVALCCQYETAGALNEDVLLDWYIQNRNHHTHRVDCWIQAVPDGEFIFRCFDLFDLARRNKDQAIMGLLILGRWKGKNL